MLHVENGWNTHVCSNLQIFLLSSTLGCEGSSMYLIPTSGGGSDTGTEATSEALSGTAPGEGAAASFADDLAAEVCGVYEACGYLVLYEDDDALCLEEISAEFYATATEESCSFDVEAGESCVAYVGTLTCNDVDDFRGGDNICSTICG
jgi:hypothetical protein